MQKQSVRIIIYLLHKFLLHETNILTDKLRKNQYIYHYYTEIIRFWSKLNYIVNKTLRSSKITNIKDKNITKYIYSAYRILWEQALPSEIIKEIDIKNKEVLDKFKTFSWEISLRNKSEHEKISIIEAIPSFMVKKLSEVMDSDFLRENFEAMNNYKQKDTFSVYLSKNFEKLIESKLTNNLINNIKITPEIFSKDIEIPNLYHIQNKYKRSFLESRLLSGEDVIILDKSSAAVVNALFPQSDELILDMCAAPGIKTRLIAQYTKNQARIIAGEFLSNRINQMRKVMKKLNIHESYLINTDSTIFPVRSVNKFDRILLDAPCTGSGTFLIHPELKWRQNEKFLHQNTIIQRKLLDKAIKLLKENGILIYSTCSLYPEEGELQVLNFLDKLTPLELPEWFSPSYKINDSIIPGTGRSFPATHHTQGFFIGKFKKKGR